MNPAFDLNTVRATLRDGIAKGYWTVAHLDQPSEGWLINEQQSMRIRGFIHPPHRNIARDPDPSERVQITSPRDFDVAAVATPNQGPTDPPILPTQWPPVPGISNAGNQPGDQDTGRPSSDRDLPQFVGATGQHLSLGPGDFLQDPEEPDTDW